ncbi:hypothetical protein K469DRAFT_701021 [Zopfia rhizophila CBS 207.26]|uniref:Uncharacterized protein n=1 Tax=Zopfia rhizophila CBS 207.26 TaxID=1314779 RepID=A0A6A6EFD6_9PEZI|nr:hypothetical protein K469DRAFT_701021 [Zopfia rhizophila CBS 207.26]
MSTTYVHPQIPPPAVSIDPNAPGTIIRIALAIEALLNITFGTYILLAPTSFLELLVSYPTSINPLSATLVQFLAAIIFANTIPLLLAIPNTRRGIEMRVPTYYVLGFSEVGLITLFAYLALAKDEEDVGLTAKALVNLAGNLVSPLVWRIFVLSKKPEWFGRYRNDVKRA